MTQAESNIPTQSGKSLSRRVAITGMCAAVAVPVAIKAATWADDPIYSLIEEHKAARAAWCASLDSVNEYQEANRTSDRALPKRDAHPVLVEMERIEEECCHREKDATVAILTTPPATLAGAVALLRYMAETNTDGQAYDVDCGDVGDSFCALIASLTVTLSPLAVQS